MLANLLFEYWNVVGDETFRTTGIRPNLFPSASNEFVRWWSLRKSDISIELHCLPRFDGLRRNCIASVSPSSIGNGRSYVKWRESNKWLRRFGWYKVWDWLNIKEKYFNCSKSFSKNYKRKRFFFDLILMNPKRNKKMKKGKILT